MNQMSTCPLLMKFFAFWGGLFGFLGVVCSALISHLPSYYFAIGGQEMGKTATQILLWHAFPLFIIPFLRSHLSSAVLIFTGSCFMAGVIIFCGAVYYTAFTGVHPGPIAPVGGTLLMVGWLGLAFAALTLKKTRD